MSAFMSFFQAENYQCWYSCSRDRWEEEVWTMRK